MGACVCVGYRKKASPGPLWAIAYGHRVGAFYKGAQGHPGNANVKAALRLGASVRPGNLGGGLPKT